MGVPAMLKRSPGSKTYHRTQRKSRGFARALLAANLARNTWNTSRPHSGEVPYARARKGTFPEYALEVFQVFQFRKAKHRLLRALDALRKPLILYPGTLYVWFLSSPGRL